MNKIDVSVRDMDKLRRPLRAWLEGEQWWQIRDEDEGRVIE